MDKRLVIDNKCTNSLPTPNETQYIRQLSAQPERFVQIFTLPGLARTVLIGNKNKDPVKTLRGDKISLHLRVSSCETVTGWGDAVVRVTSGGDVKREMVMVLL